MSADRVFTQCDEIAHNRFGCVNILLPTLQDHKPNDTGERERIESAGGCVSMKRVDGDLAVSRALGDFQYKNDRLLPQHCKVSPSNLVAMLCGCAPCFDPPSVHT